MSDEKMSLSSLHSLLTAESVSDKYYIEYNVFLSNHLSHAAIALYHLGAGEEQIRAYLDIYRSDAIRK